MAKENEHKLSGYELSRQWFDFAFENPEKITPTHCSLWFWMVELNNQLGWKAKFGLPTYHSMEAIGVKSYKTFKKTLNDLLSWGFIRLVQKAKNNHTANIIELVNFANSHTNSHTNSSLSQCISHVQVSATIDKPLNKETTETKETIALPDTFSTDYKSVNGHDSLAFTLWRQAYEYKTSMGIKPTTLLKVRPWKWTGQIKLMIEKDGRSEQEIIEVLSWLKTSSFWQGNILSPDKLRKQFERLQIEVRRPSRKALSPASMDITLQDYSKTMSND